MATAPTAGQRDAAGALYERNAQRVLGFCMSQLRRRDDAEDATQATFLRAFGALRRGVVPEQESAWLIAIARNVCRSRIAVERRRAGVEIPRDPHALAELAPVVESGSGELRSVGEALARLPERQREALLLREWHGLSYAELADELGISVSAVETLLFRARRSLERELRGERRRGVGILSLLGWLKPLVGTSVAKVAVCVVAAGLGAAASVEVARDRGTPVPVPSSAPAPVAARPAVERPVTEPRHDAVPIRHAPRRQAPVRAVAPAAATTVAAPTTEPVVSAVAPATTVAQPPPRTTTRAAAPAPTPPPTATQPTPTSTPVTTAAAAAPTTTVATTTTGTATVPVLGTPLPSVPAATVATPSLTTPAVTVASLTVPAVTVPSVTLSTPTVTVPDLHDPLGLLP